LLEFKIGLDKDVIMAPNQVSKASAFLIIMIAKSSNFFLSFYNALGTKNEVFMFKIEEVGQFIL